MRAARRQPPRQAGITLIEVLGALAVGAMLFIGLTEMMESALEDAKGQQAAHQQAQLVNAARKYLAANYGTLTAAPVSTLAAVSVDTLRTQNFLSAAHADLNSYRQNSCVLIRHAAAGKLDALVATYGGQAIPDKTIAAVALGAGPGGGYIDSTDTTRARGASWSLVTTGYRDTACGSGAHVLTGGAADAGHLVSNVFYDGPGQLSTDFLYRDAVPGKPELNRMNTPLQLAGAALAVRGNACGADPALALEAVTSNVLVCAAGTWRYPTSSWKDPVADYAALAGASPSAGDVRLTLDTGRAYAYVGGSWEALAVDQNGDMTVPHRLSAHRGYFTNDIFAVDEIWTAGLLFGTEIQGDNLYLDHDIDIGGAFSALGDVVTATHVQAGLDIWAGRDLLADADVVGQTAVISNGRMVANRFIPNGFETPGTACDVVNDYGAIKKDPATALPVICHDVGQWRYANGAIVP